MGGMAGAGEDPPSVAREKPPTAMGAKPPYTAFSTARRTFLLVIVTAGGFSAPLAGNIYLPALLTLEASFRVSAELINLTVGVFMLVFAFSPLFWGTLADISGRKLLYAVSIALFIASNVALAAAPAHYASLLVLRVLQAFGSSSVMTLGAGTIADIFEPKFRARAISFFSLGPQLGPIIGPVIGGAIIQRATWRWIFGFLAIWGFVIFIWMLFCLPETLRSRVRNGDIYNGRPWIEFPNFTRKVKITPGTPTPNRPKALDVFKMLKYPPIILVSLNVAILFGSYYCVAITFPTFLKQIYRFSPAAIGAAYLAPGIGMVVGSISSGRHSDWSRSRAVKASENGTVPAEQRLRSQYVGIILFPMGILMYGWFCHFHVHVSAVLVASFLVGFSMSWVFTTNTTYLTEVNPGRAATMVAISSLFRNPAAAIGSVIITPLVQKEGIGYCFLGLALVDLFCVGIAVTISTKGPAWRREMQDAEGQGGAAPGIPPAGPAATGSR